MKTDTKSNKDIWTKTDIITTRKGKIIMQIINLKEKLQNETGFKVDLFALEDVSELQARIIDSDLLVNATSVGMDGVSLPIPASVVLPEKLLVADVIYQPFETPFLNWARNQGNHAVNGLGMLLYQAAEAFQLWTGKEMPTDQIWELLKQKYQK